MASVAAVIKRASAAARAAMNRFDAQTMAQLRELYQTSLDAITRAINHAADGDRVPLTALDRLRHQLDQELRRLAGERNQLLAGGLEQAAELGSKPFVAALTGDELTRINFKAVEFVKQFTANDGLQLSDRLWRVDQSAKQRIGDAIEFAIIRGDDAFRAAQRMAGEIDRDAIAAASPAKLGGNIRDLMVGRGSALYQAQRVARTELNRAHGTAYMAGAESTPGCVGTRFLLSPRHPEPDICDMHATANLFGLGKGVYPPGQNPWPAHPNTLSYVVAVFDDEVTEEDKATVESQADAEARLQKPVTAERIALDAVIYQGQEISEKLLSQLRDQHGDEWSRHFPELLHQELHQAVGTAAQVKVASRGVGAKLVQAVSQQFPDSWKAASDSLGELRANYTQGRGFYRPHISGSGLLSVSDYRVAVHELTHRMQHAMPELDDYFQELHERRTKGDRQQHLQALLPGHGYGHNEVTREDNYIHPYQGKEYRGGGGRHGALEVMTMAYQWVLGPETATREHFVEQDRELFDLAIGLLFNYAPRI
jgi:hypothetical protein